MTSQPDTPQDAEPTEQEEALYSAVATTLENITGFWREAETAAMLEALAEPIAEIRRHAAADALKAEARGLDRLGAFFSKQKIAMHGTRSAETYAVHAAQAHADANRLHRAAADKLAEGYAFECAAFSQECDQRVPDAGDFCAKHEPEDDEDPRWSE